MVEALLAGIAPGLSELDPIIQAAATRKLPHALHSLYRPPGTSTSAKHFMHISKAILAHVTTIGACMGWDGHLIGLSGMLHALSLHNAR